jgi:hypothetical protein
VYKYIYFSIQIKTISVLIKIIKPILKASIIPYLFERMHINIYHKKKKKQKYNFLLFNMLPLVTQINIH